MKPEFRAMSDATGFPYESEDQEYEAGPTSVPQGDGDPGAEHDFAPWSNDAKGPAPK